MLAETIIEQLDDPHPTQRDKLARVRTHVATIRGYDDATYARVIRAIKKRLGSPKLVAELQSLLDELAEGRVSIPAPVAAPPPPPAPAIIDAPDVAGRSLVERLEAQIAADPDARDAYLAYGDHLVAQGDWRGELIAIDRELAKNPGHAKMRHAHDQLAPRALGPLADCDDLMTEVVWHMGFIKACRLAYTMERFNGERTPDATIEQVLAWLVDDPGPGRFLQHLTIGLVRHDNNHYQRVCGVLARHVRPSLRTLVLGDFTSDECELNWTELGDISDLWRAIPALTSLVLRGGRMRIGPMHLPRLERLETITGGLDDGSLHEIASADWPALVELQLQIGVGHEGAATSPGSLAPLLAAERVPRLKKLGLTNCEFTDELCTLLARSRVLGQLDELDLSMGTLTNAGLDVIEAARDRFAHLSKLVVRVDRGPSAGINVVPRPLLVGTNVKVEWDDRYGPAYE